VNRIFIFFIPLILACSPQVQQPVEVKPLWLQGKPSSAVYYVGIGRSLKTSNTNYIQAAKKSALEDLVSEIKVTVSSSSVLSTFEDNAKFREQYEQIIQTTAADEIEEFEQVETWEDATSYWVYYRLSKERYRQIKEQQKRNAVILATDFLEKAQQSEADGERLQALGYYFQAFRSIEKYLGEAIAVTIKGKDILLVNEIFASIQSLLDKIQLRVEPNELTINRRLNQNGQMVLAKGQYKDIAKPSPYLPITATFEKGGGEVFPEYKMNEEGTTKILINRITSRELEQTVGVKINLDAVSGVSNSPVFNLISHRLHVPTAQVLLHVQRPIVYLTATEKNFGVDKNNYQISNRLKNLLAKSGFEFTAKPEEADLQFEVSADSEKGSVSGSIYITYLTGVIKVKALREGKEVYATTFDRIKGYGLDYDKASQDAYNKTLEVLEKERMNELLSTVLQ
jgi:hypothetical protein